LFPQTAFPAANVAISLAQFRHPPNSAIGYLPKHRVIRAAGKRRRQQICFVKGMPNAAMDPFMNMLVWKLVPVAILCGAAWLVLHEALLWFERRITRELQSHREGRKMEWAQFIPSNGADRGEAPLCPSCNALMIKRDGPRGANAGSGFWGCSNYPECRGTRTLRQQE